MKSNFILGIKREVANAFSLSEFMAFSENG